MCGEVGARELDLFAGGEGFYGEDVGGDFVFAEEDDVAGERVGGVEGLAELEGAVAYFDGEAGAAEVAGEGQGGGVLGGAEGGDVGVELWVHDRGAGGCGVGFGLGLEGEDEAVFADGEADAGGSGAAEHLGEAVVAAAAEQGVLGAEAGGDGELEGGAGVVVEAADEARVDGGTGRRRRRARRGPASKWALGVGAEVVGDLGQGVDEVLVGFVLAVEDAEGIGVGAALVVGAELVLDGLRGLRGGRRCSGRGLRSCRRS